METNGISVFSRTLEINFAESEDDPMSTTRNFWTLSMAVSASLMLALGMVGCGDDVTGGDSGGAESEEDCADDEEWHPVTGCSAADDDNGSSDSDDDNGGSSGGGGDGDFGCDPGHIEGQACRPDGELLPQADVTVEGEDCNGDTFVETTTTDGDGNYALYDVPAGSHQMTIESGSFETQEPVAVYEGETTNLHSESAKICLESGSVDIAVIDGSMDDIQSILDNIDVEYDVVGSSGTMEPGTEGAAQFLEDPNEFFQYDILFVECSSLWGSLESNMSYDIEAIKDNIREFVEMGNSLYVSDWAYEFIREPIPEALDFHGDNARVGNGGDHVSEIVSSEFQTLLGTDTTTLDLTTMWAVAVSAGSSSNVHFAADVDTGTQTYWDAPLMAGYESSAGGRAIYTAFHNENQNDAQIEEIMEFVVFQL